MRHARLAAIRRHQSDHATLLEELLDLEMNGKIRNCPGGIYQLR